MTKKTTAMALTVLVILASFSLMMILKMARAEPEGGSVTYISNTSKVASSPDSRTDNKGTITTILLATIQQNIKWKAYVGNVSGTLVLRDADSYSIYEWPSGGDPDGEVYMTRNTSLDWNSIQCANLTQIANEQTALGHAATAVDNINNTFHYRIHEPFDVGTIHIDQSLCKSTSTWVNATSQVMSTSSLYQEVLLMDSIGKIVYTSLIDQNARGFNNRSNYDFQAIVPDFTTSSIATYYFYVEISG
jgi:hypothetical protein